MRRIARWLVVAVVLALVLAACVNGVERVEVAPLEDEPDVELASTTTLLLDSPSTTTTTAAPRGSVAAFTGLAITDTTEPDPPAFVVKIGNNNDQSRPQAGLNEADIVFEELIEGLKTRFAAVFQSQVPSEVGPIRSARTSDIGLLAGLGTPAFVFSGANAVTLSELRSAANRGLFVDAGVLRNPDPYFRLASRSAPYNLWVDMEQIDSSGVPNAVLTYGELGEQMGTEIGGVEISYPASFGRQVRHLWDATIGGWVRIQDGTLHTALSGDQEVEVAPANVVVLQIVYGRSPADSGSPEARTTGSGVAQVFTRGRIVEGTWTRSQQDPTWHLQDHTGNTINLQPGSTWLILAAAPGSRFSEAQITLFDRAEASANLASARAESRT